MMINDETYYEMYIKGKDAAAILTVIRGLKREINRLKRLEEDPTVACMMHPSYRVRVSCLEQYLKRAKAAYKEAGGEYIPTREELKSEAFDLRLSNLVRIEFYIGYYFGVSESRIYVIDADSVSAESSSVCGGIKSSDLDFENRDRGEFLSALKELNIGGWRRNYDLSRFGYEVLDGVSWHLYLYFEDGKRAVKINGYNDYPYNFKDLLDLLSVDESILREE